MSTQSVVTSGQSRVWFIEGGSSPFEDPQYMGSMKMGDPSWPQGDITPIRIPDPNKFGKFKEAGEVRGMRERVSLSVMGRYPEQLSTLLRLSRLGCRVDIQSHIGACRRGANPQDYLAGWGKIVVYRDARITTYSQENAGALSDDENNPHNEAADISAEEMYEIVALSIGQQGSDATTREVRTIDVCDSADCGDCDVKSDGCQVVLATMVGTGTTPGTVPTVVYSEDGGSTFSSDTIDSMFANETLSDAACIGTYFVVVSQTSVSLHYAPTADILNGSATWVEVTTGFVGAGAPNSMFALDPRHVWIVGEDGYIYFTSNVLSSVSVQSAGVATTQDLNDVHAFDANNIVAVGESNAVVHSENGGDTWLAVTGPDVGVELRAVWMLSETTWLVGTIAGKLWATRNSGQDWVQVGLPSSITRIDDIAFMDDVIGYIAGRTATGAAVLRTTDGGRDWYVAPESGVAIPSTTSLNQLALCLDEPNVFYAAGLAGNGTAGMILKGAGA